MTAKSSKLQRLKDFSQNLAQEFSKKNKHAALWVQQQSPQHALTAASLAGGIMMQHVDPAAAQGLLQRVKSQDEKKLLQQISEEEYKTVIDKMRAFSLMPVGHLGQEDELYLEQQVSELLGFEVTAELEGHRLNHSIGIMGGEQHLYRYPGDSLEWHDECQESGIAPARGAFGWFTDDGQLSEEEILMEKYYFAVQTLYLPDWNTNYRELKPWYKFRKMIVINPADELAVVGVVGDAGPAQWVQKQFGGSPEIIRDAKIWSPDARGRVILLFVDDPEDKVPLGVINLKDLAPEYV